MNKTILKISDNATEITYALPVNRTGDAAQLVMCSPSMYEAKLECQTNWTKCQYWRGIGRRVRNARQLNLFHPIK